MFLHGKTTDPILPDQQDGGDDQGGLGHQGLPLGSKATGERQRRGNGRSQIIWGELY